MAVIDKHIKLKDQLSNNALSNNQGQDQMGWVGRVMEDTVDRRLILIPAFPGDHPTGIAVAIESWEIAARNLQPNAVSR